MTLTSNTLVARLESAGHLIDEYYPHPYEMGADNICNHNNAYFGAIRAMLVDDEVASSTELRHASALGIPYVIDGDSSSIAFAKAILEDFRLERLMKQMLNALEFGWQPIELTWAKANGGYIPVKSDARRPEDFFIASDGRVYYRDVYYESKLVTPCKVIPVLHEQSSDQPYGETILKSVWPLFQSKWIAMANIERLGEKYSIPSVLALTEGVGELTDVSNALAPVLNGDSVALRGVKEIVTLDAKGKVTELLTNIEYLDKKIGKRITGQTLANSSERNGSRSLGEVHERAMMRLVRQDAQMVFDALNDTLFKWIFLVNGREGRIKIKVDEKAYLALVDKVTSDTKTASNVELSAGDKPWHLVI